MEYKTKAKDIEKECSEGGSGIGDDDDGDDDGVKETVPTIKYNKTVSKS